MDTRNPNRDCIPADVHEACKTLGWTPVAARAWGGEISYLVDDGLGLTEPYTRRTLLAEAAAVRRARRQRGIRQ